MSDTQPVPRDADDDSDEKYPNRPRNHARTFPFHDLYLHLFNPLNDTKKRPTGPLANRRKNGPHGPSAISPREAKRKIIQRFIMRWREEVGHDIYPAFRMIVPEKDRERAMYGLKEKTIGKLLVQIVKIDKDSEDAQKLLNWKLPGQRFSTMAGDFAGRCFEVISKRPIRTTPGDLTIEEVNDMLDKLSVAQKEEEQRSIMQQFYQRMNAEEMMWLVRIILRQMKIGATERTIFEEWHPDAETLFNVSSSLKRVCWELSSHSTRLAGEETDINLMQCFQPQLAQFQTHSFDNMVQRLRPTETDKIFWIEEKLDGERMQLHMIEDDSLPGQRRFAFWSRKAKDYTYLYGSHLEDDNSALTRHLGSAFKSGVRNIILDGEMITWSMEADKIVEFGTLKTAALDQQKNPQSMGNRPVFKVFDILYLNDTALTRYTLRDRRNALEQSVNSIHRRMEIHAYKEATSATEIEPMLRDVVQNASEGLVVKSPRSMYRLNERNDDWIKVKPDYMTEFGESIDCIVVGGYYGSGHRGGALSSFLCGLRVDQNHISAGADPNQVVSFFKVGGGMTAADYQSIQHHTEGKWQVWDTKNPPLRLIKLGGGDRQHERPDVWIHPQESIVIEAKAASMPPSESFAAGYTLRFPRFKCLRLDKSFSSALTVSEFQTLRDQANKEHEEKQFTIDRSRKAKRQRTGRPLAPTVVGAPAPTEQTRLLAAAAAARTSAPTARLFAGLTFLILTDALAPRRSRPELEALVKAHGGALTQSRTHPATIPIADRRLVPVASLQKTGVKSIIRPGWIVDCIAQAEADAALGRAPLLLPYEARHVFWVRPADDEMVRMGGDAFGDGYARDVDAAELRELLDGMPAVTAAVDDGSLEDYVEDTLGSGDGSIGRLFKGVVAWFADGARMDVDGAAPDVGMEIAATKLVFSGARLVRSLDDAGVTHVVVGTEDATAAYDARQRIAAAGTTRLPRVVQVDWVEQSWRARTQLDEQRFEPR